MRTPTSSVDRAMSQASMTPAPVFSVCSGLTMEINGSEMATVMAAVWRMTRWTVQSVEVKKIVEYNNMQTKKVVSLPRRR